MACLSATDLLAQDQTELLNRMKAMEDRVKALEAELQTLKAQQAAPAPAPSQQPVVPVAPQAQPAPPLVQGPGVPPTLGGAGPAAAKALNPDISVIGDFIGSIGYPGNRFTPSLEMHETEVGFQEVIDPYSRADFFITFGEHGVDLEEGYITFTALPAGLQLKVGKMRAAFGKVNLMHNHVLPWIDRPLMTQDLVGGEDGINDAGLSLSKILPAPKGVFLEGTVQVYRGDSLNVFRAINRSDISTVGHLRSYYDINESTNIDLGVSFAHGHSPFANGSNSLWGADATVRWKPLRRSIYRSFVGRGEVVWAQTSVSPYLLPVTPTTQTITPFGFYASADYQLKRRWFLGARFDRSQRGACLPTNPPTIPCIPLVVSSQLLQDTGGSVVLTYWPSEFSQIRGQFRRTGYGEGFLTNEFLFQFLFSMGAHGAHPF
jgi:hypothetical protein